MTAFARVDEMRMEPPWRALLRRFIANRVGALGSIIVVGVVLAAIVGPALSPADPIDGEIAEKHQGPSLAHPLGTDFLGRDQLARVLHGARASVFSALALMAVTIAISVVVGVTAGFLGGVVDAILMRLVEVVLAFPSLMLALAVAGFLGPGLRNALIALGAVWWAGFARIVRAQVLSLRSREFIQAATALGATRTDIVRRHILPNITGQFNMETCIKM